MVKVIRTISGFFLLALLCGCISFSAYAGSVNPETSESEETETETEAVVPDYVMWGSRPKKIEYYVGEKLDVTGGALRVVYTDGSTRDVDLTESMVSGFDSGKSTSRQVLTVNYVEGDLSAQLTYEIYIKNNAPQSIKITKEPEEKEFICGSVFHDRGIEVTVTYSDGSSDVLYMDDIEVEEPDISAITGEYLDQIIENGFAMIPVTVKYQGLKDSYEIKLTPIEYELTMGLRTVSYKSSKLTVTHDADGKIINIKDGTMIFGVDSAYDDFFTIYIDGEKVRSSSFSADPDYGKTIITVTRNFIQDLDYGQHDVVFVFEDGVAKTDFQVTSAPYAPEQTETETETETETQTETQTETETETETETQTETETETQTETETETETQTETETETESEIPSQSETETPGRKSSGKLLWITAAIIAAACAALLAVIILLYRRIKGQEPVADESDFDDGSDDGDDD